MMRERRVCVCGRGGRVRGVKGSRWRKGERKGGRLFQGQGEERGGLFQRGWCACGVCVESEGEKEGEGGEEVDG